PAVLDDAEMKVMRGHPAIGDGIVNEIDLLKKIRPMVRNHHERFDGSGYPDGMRGDEIPIGARIIAVADTYDAITSDRPYQPGRPPREAVPILKRLSGVTLDEKVVKALLDALVEIGALEPADVSGEAEAPTPAPAPSGTPERALRPTLDFPI